MSASIGVPFSARNRAPSGTRMSRRWLTSSLKSYVTVTDKRPSSATVPTQLTPSRPDAGLSIVTSGAPRSSHAWSTSTASSTSSTMTGTDRSLVSSTSVHVHADDGAVRIGEDGCQTSAVVLDVDVPHEPEVVRRAGVEVEPCDPRVRESLFDRVDQPLRYVGHDRGDRIGGALVEARFR